MSASGQTKPSADAFPQVGFVIQPVDLHPKEITSRDDAPNPSALDDRKMTETAIAHLTQCVYCAIIGSDGNGIGRSNDPMLFSAIILRASNTEASG